MKKNYCINKLLIFILSISLSLSLSSCFTTSRKVIKSNMQKNGEYDSSFMYEGVAKLNDLKKNTNFDPTNKATFVVDSENSYNFCLQANFSMCLEKLDLGTNDGVDGYFLEEKPIFEYDRTLDSERYYYPIVIKPGRKLYFMELMLLNDKKIDLQALKKNQSLLDREGIMSKKTYQELKAFKPEPIVPGSKINLIKVYEYSYGENNNNNSFPYATASGKKLSPFDLNFLRFINKKSKFSDSLINQYLNFNINYDKVQDIYFLQSEKTYKINIILDLYIGYNKTTSQKWLRFKANYRAEDWLFVDKLKFVADDFRWEMNDLYSNFKREVVSYNSTIKEIMDVPAGSILNNLKKTVKANEVIVRFQGRGGAVDYILTEEQKNMLQEAINVYQAIK